MNEVEITCDIIGRERIVGACIELSGELFTPGFVLELKDQLLQKLMYH